MSLPPRGAIPVFACIRQESGFSPGHNAHKSILLLWHISILTKLQKNGCKTIAAVLYTVETQACIHFMKGIQHGWGGWFCENLYYKQHRNRSCWDTTRLSGIKKLVDSLKKFEDEVSQFKMKNKDAKGLGFTHLHLKDYSLPSELAGSAYIAATTYSSSRRSRSSGGSSNMCMGRRGPVRMTVWRN